MSSQTLSHGVARIAARSDAASARAIRPLSSLSSGYLKWNPLGICVGSETVSVLRAARCRPVSAHNAEGHARASSEAARRQLSAIAKQKSFVGLMMVAAVVSGRTLLSLFGVSPPVSPGSRPSKHQFRDTVPADGVRLEHGSNKASLPSNSSPADNTTRRTDSEHAALAPSAPKIRGGNRTPHSAGPLEDLPSDKAVLTRPVLSNSDKVAMNDVAVGQSNMPLGSIGRADDPPEKATDMRIPSNNGLSTPDTAPVNKSSSQANGSRSDSLASRSNGVTSSSSSSDSSNGPGEEHHVVVEASVPISGPGHSPATSASHVSMQKDNRGTLFGTDNKAVEADFMKSDPEAASRPGADLSRVVPSLAAKVKSTEPGAEVSAAPLSQLQISSATIESDLNAARGSGGHAGSGHGYSGESESSSSNDATLNIVADRATATAVEAVESGSSGTGMGHGGDGGSGSGGGGGGHNGSNGSGSDAEDDGGYRFPWVPVLLFLVAAMSVPLAHHLWEKRQGTAEGQGMETSAEQGPLVDTKNAVRGILAAIASQASNLQGSLIGALSEVRDKGGEQMKIMKVGASEVAKKAVHGVSKEARNARNALEEVVNSVNNTPDNTEKGQTDASKETEANRDPRGWIWWIVGAGLLAGSAYIVWTARSDGDDRSSGTGPSPPPASSSDSQRPSAPSAEGLQASAPPPKSPSLPPSSPASEDAPPPPPPASGPPPEGGTQDGRLSLALGQLSPRRGLESFDEQATGRIPSAMPSAMRRVSDGQLPACKGLESPIQIAADGSKTDRKAAARALHQSISQAKTALQSYYQDLQDLGQRYQELEQRGAQFEASQEQEVRVVQARLQQVQDSVRQSSSLRAPNSAR